MRSLFTLLAFVLLGQLTVSAQQDPMFTKYMFNSLTFNPAYAGSYEHLYVGLLHRSQWVNFNGAPQTQTVTAHTPLKLKRVGVGLSMMNDVIGPTRWTNANLAYSYRIPLGGSLKLAVGIQGGLSNYRADWNQVNLPDAGPDEAFMGIENRWLPNFGAGVDRKSVV